MAKKKIEKITDLRPQHLNANKHSARGLGLLEDSIARDGWIGAITVAADGETFDGSARIETGAANGFSDAIVVESDGSKPVVVVRRDIPNADDPKAKRLGIAANRVAQVDLAWDTDVLAEIAAEQDLSDLFTADEFEALLADAPDLDSAAGGLTDADEVPDNAPTRCKSGDLWQLGRHRLLCGDSTKSADVARLMGGEKATLCHADPPYGMGKEKDGVENDNLYADKLDAFQMAWWRAWRPFLNDNASAYIWGNAPDLWRLWYRGGLGDSERLEMRNEIIWDKKNIPGMASPLMTQYPEASERCLFFQAGAQSLGNVNSYDFPESWEPVRGYMEQEATLVGIGAADIKRICGCGMYSHWFTRSQFTLIPENHYKALGVEYPGRFQKPWRELKKEWDKVKSGPQLILESVRSYFDNAHDVMRDVWEFPRVVGDDRHGHATPKPVAMIERAIKSSAPDGSIVVEPFAGSGTTLMACEQTGRRCFTCEISPKYCDVILQRWENFTGLQAELIERAEQ